MFSTTTAVGQTGKKIDTGIILLHDYYRRQEVAGAVLPSYPADDRNMISLPNHVLIS